MTGSAGDWRSRYGPWALIAGASEGIGAEFARQLATRGLDLVLAARRREPLEALSLELTTKHGVKVRTESVDLADANAVATLGKLGGELEIGLLVYNAALSVVGRFLDQHIEAHLRELDVNCRGPLLLIGALAPRMVERRRGGVILMSSLSGIQGTPFIANYAATKAWNLILGESLWGELSEHGVDAMTVLAGATRTPGYEANTRGKKLKAPLSETDAVVSTALAALGKRPSVIAGGANRAAAFLLSRLLPRPSAVRIMGKATLELLPDPGVR